MRNYGPSTFTDQLFRSGLTLLLTMAILFIAWELASRLLGPLAIVLVLFGLVRLTAGFGGRSRW